MYNSVSIIEILVQFVKICPDLKYSTQSHTVLHGARIYSLRSLVIVVLVETARLHGSQSCNKQGFSQISYQQITQQSEKLFKDNTLVINLELSSVKFSDTLV